MAKTTTFEYMNGCASCGTPRQLLTAVTDPKGNTTRFDYNALGQLILETNPAGHQTHYQFDGDRNLIQIG